MRSGTWSAFEGEELRGKTLGIVGNGAVGAELCRIAAGFVMNCIAWNRSTLPHRFLAKKYRSNKSSATPMQYRFISLFGYDEQNVRCPVSAVDETRGNLVNTARGSVVDDVALIEALGDGATGSRRSRCLHGRTLKVGHHLQHAE